MKKVNIIIYVNDNICYRIQKEVFLLLGKEERVVSENGYCEYDDEYDIWFPIISSEKSRWNNYLSCDGNMIEEYPDEKGTREDVPNGKKRIVFAKFYDGFKFIGIFIPDERENENRRKVFYYKKIANSIIVSGGKENE